MSLSHESPEKCGMDARRLALADSMIARGADEGIYSAAVLVVARHGKITHEKPVGVLEPGSRDAAHPDTIFDLASLTKPHVACSLLTLLEEGKIALTQTVEELLPEAKGAPVGPVTMRQLATHTSGLPPWKPLYKLALPESEKPKVGESYPPPFPPPAVGAFRIPADARHRIFQAIFDTPLANPPGTRYAYSDMGYMLIGEIASRVGEMPLDQFVHARVLAPLGMNDSGYLPASPLKDRIAATAHSALQGPRMTRGSVHDENSFALGGVAGHAGLFGTAPDLAILGSALAMKGEANGHRLFGIPTLRLIRTNQVDPAVGGHSIGWFTPPNGMLPRGDILPDTTFGHTGFTGTMLVIDPSHELAVVLLTNRVVNPTDNGGMARIRRRVLNIVASSIIR